MTSLRAVAGVIATCATTIMLSGWIYWLYLWVYLLDQPEFDAYSLGVKSVHPFLFYLPAGLGITANVLTLTDLFRHRTVRIGKAVLVIVIVWLLGALSTWLYWLGEFRKALGRSLILTRSASEGSSSRSRPVGEFPNRSGDGHQG